MADTVLIFFYLISIMSGGEVVERRSLLALGNILGLGQAEVLLLRASLWVGDHLGPVDDHVLGQLADLVDVFANTIDAFLLNLPVSQAVIGGFLTELSLSVID